MDAPYVVPDEVRGIFRHYIASVRELIELSNLAFVKGWPDRKHALAVVARLGNLNCDLQQARFEYVVDHQLLTREACKCLSSISDRIWKEWTTAEETALTGASEHYREIVAAMTADRAVHDRSKVDGPIDHATRDPEYRRAATGHAERCWELDARLKALTSP
jgi:hypothetical protein